MPSTDTGYDNLEDDSGLGGGWGGYYDPTLIPGYYNVMGNDPLGTDPNSVYAADAANFMGQNTGGLENLMSTSAYGGMVPQNAMENVSETGGGYDPTDPGFTDPNGGWVANPGYDPSTINNLPNVNSTPNVNPDPMGGGYDPTSGSGVAGDPYNLGDNTPVFQGGTTQQGPQDPNTPQIGQPPAASNPPMDPFPAGIGNGLPTPYPPPGTMTTGNTNITPPPPRGGTAPTTPPAKTPVSASASPSPAPSSNFSLALGGMPAISSTLPGSSNFSYQPISIARQGAPNAGVPPSVATQAGQAGATPGAAPSPLNPFSRLLMDQQNQQKKSNSIYDTGL